MIQCLQLNVYVPNTANATNKLPVMVYLHGGSFVQGNKGKANFSPIFLIRHDVLIITINYRLGPYGFLCISEPGFSNQGLKDQILALKWIKENIGVFGGDVNKITAFGQSAGAMTLDILLLTNEDLVQRAILQSGFALTTWVIATQNDTIPVNIAKRLGYNGANVTAAMKFLSSNDPINVIQSANDLEISSNVNPLTRPCVEKDGVDALLIDFPVNLSPKVKCMDLMIGYTDKEVMFAYAKQTDKEFYKSYKFGDELAKGFDGVYDEDIVRHFYIGDKVLSERLQSDILDYGTDFVFCHPADITVDRYLNANASSVRRYVFSYEGNRNRIKIQKNLTSEGASHGDDLGYLFDSTMFAYTTTSLDDQKMIDRMTTMWTNFAKHGDPTPSTSELISVEWKPTKRYRRPFLNLNKTLKLGSRPFYKRMAFWDLYYKLHAAKVKGYKRN